MVPQICDIKLTGGKKLQVREVSDYFFSPIFPLLFRDDSMISGLRPHCSGSSCQISGGQKDLLHNFSENFSIRCELFEA